MLSHPQPPSKRYEIAEMRFDERNRQGARLTARLKMSLEYSLNILLKKHQNVAYYLRSISF